MIWYTVDHDLDLNIRASEATAGSGLLVRNGRLGVSPVYFDNDATIFSIWYLRRYTTLVPYKIPPSVQLSKSTDE